MKTEIISQEKNITVVKAEYDVEEVKKAIDATFATLSNKANIKGFRKGHVPRKTLEMFFGKKGIYGETIEKLVPEAIDKMIEEYELKLIAEPSINPGQMEEGKGFEVEVTFEVTPEITYPELDTIDAEKTIYKVTDEMVDENITRILEAYGEVVPTYEERPLTKEDYVSVKYSSFVLLDGGKEEAVETDEKTEINLGQAGLRPEVADGLIGKKPGEKVTVEFKASEMAQNKKLSGKTMRYEIEVLGVMKRVVPELTDEKVIEITKSKHKTVDEFRAEVRKQLDKNAAERSEESLKGDAIAKICDASEVELPETLINRQKESIRKGQEDDIKRNTGMTMEEFFAQGSMSKDAYDGELEKAAKHVVKQALVLEAIAEANDIEWTPEELNLEIQRMAVAAGVDVKKFQDYVYEDRGRLFEIAEKIRNRKTMDFIITKVNVSEVEEKADEPVTEGASEEKKEAE